MKYYFASRYSNNPELRRCRDELEEAIPGSIVTSRWIDCHADIVGGLDQSFTPEALSADPVRCWQYGAHDVADIEAADTLVSFTGAGGKGGRHIEHGYALALGKRIVVIGQRENIFHTHPSTEHFADWPAFLKAECER